MKYISLNNLGSKHSLLMKFGQFMSYYKRKTFVKKILQKLRPQNWSHALLCVQRIRYNFCQKMKFLKQAIYIRYVIAKLRPDQLAQLLRFLFTEDSLEIKKGFAFVIEFFIKNFPLHYCINWPNFLTRLCLLPKLIIKMCLLCVSRHNIRISEKLKFDCLKKEKSS